MYTDDKIQLAKRYRTEGLTLTLARDWFACWWRAKSWSLSLRGLEFTADLKGRWTKWEAWGHGLRTQGWRRAWEEANGLVAIA